MHHAECTAHSDVRNRSRPNRLVRLLLAIDDGLLCVGRTVARSVVDGLAAHGMAQACYTPEHPLDRSFKRTMDELRTLARAASQPGYVAFPDDQTDA